MKRTPWTPESLDMLRALYADNSGAAVAKALGRRIGPVYQMAARLGLRKSAEYLASDNSGRIARGRQDPRMIASQIKPGNVPWNKGVPGSTGLHPNSRATHFKAGRAPQEARNYKPIGTLRVNKDGHLERKMSDDTSIAPALRWSPVYRQVWEAANGPIPADNIIVFKRGQKTSVLEEITVGRLECITRAQNAQRNHPRTQSPELGKLIQLKGAITRQVNRITRESRERATP